MANRDRVRGRKSPKFQLPDPRKVRDQESLDAIFAALETERKKQEEAAQKSSGSPEGGGGTPAENKGSSYKKNFEIRPPMNPEGISPGKNLVPQGIRSSGGPETF